jgi:transposase
MAEVCTIGLDLAKHVFQAHGADASGAVLFRKKLRRAQVLSFFATQPPGTVAMEACGSAHHLGARDRQARSCRAADPTGLREDAMRG